MSTSTASGKSLIFQTHAFDLMEQNTDSTILVFNPLRALAQDQLGSWRQLATENGIREDLIVKIDGSIPTSERYHLLDRAAVAIVTPDICQAWLMRNSTNRSVRDFIGNLRLMVIDEAHVYDSVFGSNAAYLFRRTLALRDQYAPPAEPPCQIVGATATISNAAEHMTNLTGRQFAEVGEDDNGAQLHERTLYHIEGETEEHLSDVIQRMVRMDHPPKFIAFMDSRQGVERVARRIRGGRVLAYRSGYEAEDRQNIEAALRDGQLTGVVSTAALEMGINIPGLTVGVNLRVPATRKAFRQRIGRVGRDGPGAFLIIGPVNLFSRFGETLKQYYEASAEPSLLYLGNRYIQFANAQCMDREMDVGSETLESDLWPAGFQHMVEMNRNQSHPQEYDAIERSGRRRPHLAHSVRAMPGPEINIVVERDGTKIGSTTLEQAMREAYPGANYLHRGRVYQAANWETNGQYGQLTIPVTPRRSNENTDPVEEKDITVRGVVDNNLILHQDGQGYIAEVYASIRSEVVGFSTYSATTMYDDDMIRPQRYFDTTGVMLRIGADWAAWTQNREQIGYLLQAILRYDQSIASWDIGHSEQSVRIQSKVNTDGETSANTILIYDDTSGSLRLTEALFHNVNKYVSRLSQAVRMDGEPVNRELIANLLEWTKGLRAKPTSH